jgi:hypothetical protein
MPTGSSITTSSCTWSATIAFDPPISVSMASVPTHCIHPVALRLQQGSHATVTFFRFALVVSILFELASSAKSELVIHN